MVALFITNIPLPLPNNKLRIVTAEREVCSNFVDLRIDLMKTMFRIFAKISLKFTMRSE
jgi:hypothetical protein